MEEDTSSAGNTSHVHASNGTSPLLPRPPHTALLPLALLRSVVGSFTKVSKSGSWPIADGTWDKEGMTRCSVAQAVGGGQNSLLHQCSFYLGNLNCEEDVMGLRLYNQTSINVTVPSVVVWGCFWGGFFLIAQKNEGWVSGARHFMLVLDYLYKSHLAQANRSCS